MDSGFWAAILIWGSLGGILVTLGVILQVRENSRNK